MKYIPQAAPFELIDHLVTSQNGETTTEFTIPAQHVLVENGFLTTGGLLENMAQTAASGVAYEAHKTNTPPPVGFIGAIKDFSLMQLPKVGDKITTRIVPITAIGTVQVVQGEIFLAETVIAKAEFKIFLQ